MRHNPSVFIWTIQNLDDFDLNLLRIFDALWQKQHVGRAAASLGLSQPAFSYSLKRLREQLGDQLFIRTRSGMQPTAEAERLAPTISAILEQVRGQLLSVQPFDPASSTRTFTLSMSDLGEMVFLPKLLKRLSRIAPGVNVRTFAGRPGDLMAAMENGELDLMMGYFPDTRGADVFQQRLFSHGFICLARAGHPGVADGMNMEAFLALPHAAIYAEGRSQEIVEQYFKEHGIRRRLQLQTQRFLSIPFVIAATDMVVTIPEAVGEMFSQLAGIRTFRPPMALPGFDIKQYWHRRQHNDVANRWLRGVTQALFSGEEGWHLEVDE